jgi:SAM-dependent methyltransferase
MPQNHHGLRRLLRPGFAKELRRTPDGIYLFGGKVRQFCDKPGHDRYGDSPEWDGDKVDGTLRSFIEETCAADLPFGVGLDFGCGTGRTITTFEGLVKLPIGLEISMSRLKRYAASPEAKRIRPFLINHEGKLPFRSGSVDFISFITVYEHLPDPVPYLREFHRILRKGGVLFAVNDAWFYEKVAALGLSSIAKRDRTHVYMKTPDFMERQIREAGFLVERKAYLPYARWGIRATPKPLNRLATKGMVVARK